MNASTLRKLAIDHMRIDVDGNEYVVTTGTGEMNYGSDLGGSAAFAYLASDVDEMDDVADYGEFCDAIDTEEDRDLAIALAAREGLRLTHAGACTPVLSDEEYLLVRAAVAAVAS
jgi:hypothetical protein